MNTFEELKKCACDFWGLDLDQFQIFDENLNDLMSLGGDERDHYENEIMRVENYFKVILAKNNPTLILAKANRTQSQLLPSQKSQIKLDSNQIITKKETIKEESTNANNSLNTE